MRMLGTKLSPDLVDESGALLPLLDVDDPAAAELVGFVLPHRLDAALEEGVVAASAQL